jgi:hypothetical protein
MPPQISPSQSASVAYSRIVAIGGTIALVATAFATLRLRANLQKIFIDFGADLPSITQMVMALPWWAIAGLFVAPALWLLFKDALVRDAKIRRQVSVAIGFAMVAWLIFLAMSFVLPLAMLHERLS